jgi:hypothetical protein
MNRYQWWLCAVWVVAAVATVTSPALSQADEADAGEASQAESVEANQAEGENDDGPASGQVDAAPLGEQDLTVKALEVTGRVLSRQNSDADWQSVAEGDVLPIGSTIRTMLRSEVRLQLGPENTVLLDELGTISLVKLAADQNVLRTRILKKYGRLEFNVEKDVPFQNDFQMATPGSVLAVRGTKGSHSQYDRLQVRGQAGLFTLERPYGTVYLVGPRDLVNDQMLGWVSDFVETMIARETDPNMRDGASLASPREQYLGGFDRGQQLRSRSESGNQTEMQVRELERQQEQEFLEN